MRLTGATLLLLVACGTGAPPFDGGLRDARPSSDGGEDVARDGGRPSGQTPPDAGASPFSWVTHRSPFAPGPLVVRRDDHLLIGNPVGLLQYVSARAGEAPRIVAQRPLRGVPMQFETRGDSLFVLVAQRSHCTAPIGPSTCSDDSALLRFDLAQPERLAQTGQVMLSGHCADLRLVPTGAIVACRTLPSTRAHVYAITASASRLEVADRAELCGGRAGTEVFCFGERCAATALVERSSQADTRLDVARVAPETGRLVVNSTNVTGVLLSGDALTSHGDRLRMWSTTWSRQTTLTWLRADDLALVASFPVRESAGVRVIGERAFLLPATLHQPLHVYDVSSAAALPLLDDASVRIDSPTDVVAVGERALLLSLGRDGIALTLAGDPEPPPTLRLPLMPIAGPRSLDDPGLTWSLHEAEGLVSVRVRGAADAGQVAVVRVQSSALSLQWQLRTDRYGIAAQPLGAGRLALWDSDGFGSLDLAAASQRWMKLTRAVRGVATADALAVQLTGKSLGPGELVITPSDDVGAPNEIARLPLEARDVQDVWFDARPGRAYVLQQVFRGVNGRGSPQERSEFFSIDLSVPEAPRVGAKLLLPGTERLCVPLDAAPHHLACYYTGSPHPSISLVDASDFDAPQLLAPLQLPEGHRTAWVRSRANLLEVISQYLPAPVVDAPPPPFPELRRYDTRALTTPVLLSTTTLRGYPLQWYEDTLYVSDAQGLIRRYDTSAALVETALLAVPPGAYFSARGDVGFVSTPAGPDQGFNERTGELWTLALGDPARFVVRARTAGFAGFPLVSPSAMVLIGSNHLFVNRVESDGTLRFEHVLSGEPQRAFVYGDRLFVACRGTLEEL